jgi:Na+/proline symporter
VLYAPSLAISSLVPALNIFVTIFGLGFVTTAYTVYGGMHAVVRSFP